MSFPYRAPILPDLGVISSSSTYAHLPLDLQLSAVAPVSPTSSVSPLEPSLGSQPSSAVSFDYAPIPSPPPPRQPSRYPFRLCRSKELTDGTILWPPPLTHITTTAKVPIEPTSVVEALKHADCLKALQAEF